MRHSMQERLSWTELLQGRRCHDTVLFDSMAPWRYSFHGCSALHFIVLFASQPALNARREMSAEPPDVQENSFSKSAANSSQIRRRVPVWKTIRSGRLQIRLPSHTHWMRQVVASETRLRNSRPTAFTLARRKQTWSLLRCPAAELGFQTDTRRRWRTFYALARQLGFGLAAAESLRKLRLQYLDQPIGEFLVGMEPIKTWKGEPVILTVANAERDCPHRPGWQRRRRNTRGVPFSVRAVQ